MTTKTKKTGKTAPTKAAAEFNSQLVSALEKAWTNIRKHHADLPPAVIVVASGGVGGMVLGHFAESRWVKKGTKTKTAEVLISGEGLSRGAVNVMGTLLHEAAHALATAREVKDTSRSGRYHNSKFAAIAAELGLTAEKQGARGLAHTEVKPETSKRYKATIVMLKKAIAKSHRVVEGGLAKKPSRMLLAMCECERKIRLSRATYEEADIMCSGCETPFAVEDDAEGGEES
jgi:hypothetical protein